MSVATLEPELEPIIRLNKDLRNAAKLMGRNEARYLVDTYYQIQKFRIASEAQIRTLEENHEPNALLAWVHGNTTSTENGIRSALGTFAKEYRVGKWLQGICGIGPVISAGILAEFDVRNRTTAGHFWAFAGLDASKKWEKGKKRPWNARLKTLLAFKAGESFVKTQNRDEAFYGKLFADRKVREWNRNLDGLLAPEAARMLREKDFKRDTGAKKWYSGCVDPEWARLAYEAGDGWPVALPAAAIKEADTFPAMLPPAHVHARARRWTVKLFVSHIHEVMYRDYYEKDPPMPFVMTKHPDAALHTHYVPAQGWPVSEGLGLKRLLG